MTTPKRSPPAPLALFPLKLETATRANTTCQKAPTSHSPDSSMPDDNVAKPLEKLQKRRKSSHVSDPLSASINRNIKFFYPARPTSISKPNITLSAKKEKKPKQET